MHSFDLLKLLDYYISKKNLFYSKKTLDNILNRIIDEHRRNIIDQNEVQETQKKLDEYFKKYMNWKENINYQKIQYQYIKKVTYEY
jgi:hypothetical protein